VTLHLSARLQQCKVRKERKVRRSLQPDELLLKKTH
jgi:hypothetical protein